MIPHKTAEHNSWKGPVFNDLVWYYFHKDMTFTEVAKMLSKKYNRYITKNSCVGAYNRRKGLAEKLYREYLDGKIVLESLHSASE